MLVLIKNRRKSLFNVTKREQRWGQKVRLLRERPWEPDLVALERLDLSQLVEPALTVWWSYYARRTAFCMIEEKLSSLFRCFFLNFQMLSLVN